MPDDQRLPHTAKQTANRSRRGPMLRALRETARQEYSKSKATFWLAAFPASLGIDSCTLKDPACGTVINGKVLLPWGGLHPLGCVKARHGGEYQLIVFSLVHRTFDEVERFKLFAADAGAAMLAAPPAWAQQPISTQADSVTLWVASLIFLSPTAKTVAEKPGGCLFITQPWAASLVALREWRVNVATKLNSPAQELMQRKASHAAVPLPASGAAHDTHGSRAREKRKRGRPSDTDAKADKRIADAWKTRHYRTTAELAKALGLTENQAYRALDRHRKRQKRSVSGARTKSMEN